MLWRRLGHIPADELIAWRVLACCLVLVPVVSFTRRWGEVKKAFTCRSTLWRMLVSTLLIGFNWFLFIWAVNAGRVLETSLGYYMMPLLTVALGTMLLGERLSRVQSIAIGLAAIGVLWALLAYGDMPWVGVLLAVSFGLYGLIRKTVHVEALPGLFVETISLLPLALCWLGHLWVSGRLAVGYDPMDMSLLLFAGVATAVPMLLFAYSARHVPLSTLGFLQYVSPTGSFLIGIFILMEPISNAMLVTFGFIWAALVLQSLESLHLGERIAALRKRSGQNKG